MLKALLLFEYVITCLRISLKPNFKTGKGLIYVPNVHPPDVFMPWREAVFSLDVKYCDIQVVCGETNSKNIASFKRLGAAATCRGN